MSELKGYNGKIAFVDLSTEKIEIKDLTPEIADAYIGGVGLSAKLTYDLLKEDDYETLKKDPLAGVNPLIFATGPLTGTATPSSSRYSVCGISPLTGIWGESTSGGFFPVAFKRSGFDAIVITGEASTPKMLHVSEGNIQILSAEDTWGLNTRKTITKIKENLNDQNIRVACIGKAGENLVKYACIINDEGRAAGRCGLGALMGKKNLKALSVKSSAKIEYEDSKTIVKEAKSAIKTITNSFSTNFFSNHGTLCYTDMGMVLGDVPAKYFTTTEFVAEHLTGKALKENFPVIKYACAGCTIGCGRTTIMEKGGEEIEIDGPEYETVAAYGPLCGVTGRFDMILEANHLCNLEGMDTISSGVSIAFLLYLVEQGLAKDKIAEHLKDVKIEDLTWGNESLVLKLANKIVKREGIGELLAEGVKIMAEKLGVNPGLAAHVKGLEIPMHDPRAYHGQALSYATCCVGASHEKGDFFNIDGDAASFRKVTKGDRFDLNGREAGVALYQDICNIFDSATICNFPHINMNTISRLFKSSTGLPNLGNKRKLLVVGERATHLKRLINCKLGITREDDKLPEIVTKTLLMGGSIGQSLDLEEHLKTYYEVRGWDWETGWPTKEKLAEFGIE